MGSRDDGRTDFDAASLKKLAMRKQGEVIVSPRSTELRVVLHLRCTSTDPDSLCRQHCGRQLWDSFVCYSKDNDTHEPLLNYFVSYHEVGTWASFKPCTHWCVSGTGRKIRLRRTGEETNTPIFTNGTSHLDASPACMCDAL